MPANSQPLMWDCEQEKPPLSERTEVQHHALLLSFQSLFFFFCIVPDPKLKGRKGGAHYQSSRLVRPFSPNESWYINNTFML